MHRVLLQAFSLLVPAWLRREWLDEWQAELWHVEREGRATVSPARFCAGAFRDAAYLRGQDFRQRRRGGVFSTPAVCLAMLTLQASIAATGMWMMPAVRSAVWKHALESHGVIILGALLLYRALSGPISVRSFGFRGWWFMAAKAALLIVLVYSASFDAAPIISRTPIPQTAFVGYVLAIRWAIGDQRRRCPRCLRRLSHPVRIGHPAGTLLDWYGDEFVCANGHGVLHEPEPMGSSYCARQWVGMDASWRELFEPAER